MRCVALSYAWIASHIQTEHWIHSAFELGLFCFCCRLHPHGLYIYLASQSDTFSTWSERTATKKMLLLSRPSSSSSIHDAHFLCLQHIVVVVATFAFDSIFYPSAFFRCSCCAGPKPHCVLFRLQIALVVCVSVCFLHEFHSTLAHCTLCVVSTCRKYTSSWLVFTAAAAAFSQYSLFFLPFENNSINIVLCVRWCLLFGSNNGNTSKSWHITDQKLCLKNYKNINEEWKRKRKHVEKKTFSPFRYFLCVCAILNFLPSSFRFAPTRSFVPNYSICSNNNNSNKITLKTFCSTNKKKSKDENHITKMRMASVWNQIGERMRKREKKSVQIHFNEKAANAKRMMSRTFQLNGKIECWWRTNFLLKKEWKKKTARDMEGKNVHTVNTD